VRKEIAIVRGSVENNRVAEGVNLYGDEEEPGVEEKIFITPTSTTSTAVGGATGLPY
jgi:hypothetical protein